MADANLHAVPEMLSVPSFPLLRRNFCCQNLGPNSLFREKVLKPPRNVALLRVYSEHLDLTTLCELVLYLFDQAPLFGIHERWVKVRGLRNDEPLAFAGLLVGAVAVKRPEVHTAGRDTGAGRSLPC